MNMEFESSESPSLSDMMRNRHRKPCKKSFVITFLLFTRVLQVFCVILTNHKKKGSFVNKFKEMFTIWNNFKTTGSTEAL